MKNKTIWDRIIDLAMLVAAGMLYFKTAQVMTVFAPSVVFGYTGLEVLFGNVTALLVEGVVLAIHFLPSLQSKESANFFKWFLFAISALCQVVDGFIVQGTLNQQPESMQFIVGWGVPLIPTAIFLGLLMIGSDHADYGTGSKVRISDIGLKNMLPDFNKLWNGNGVVNVPVSQPVEVENSKENFQEGSQG